VRLWKWIGIAGLVGVGAVAAGYAVQRRRRRTWREYDPDELRDRLRARLAAAESAA
jgi:hypothetical protein